MSADPGLFILSLLQAALNFPEIDPIAVQIGPFTLPWVEWQVGPLAVRWYGLMYMFGFVAGWWLGRRRARQPGSSWRAVDVDDLIFYCVIGVIVGGRLGWVLFYGTEYVTADPWMIVQIWKGGMAFHGGLLGVVLAMWLFARRRSRHFGDVLDFVAPLPALGLFAGRIGNFINGELWGKVTDVPWAFVYQGEARHPSQLYEALLEGLVIFVVVWWFTAKPRPRLAPAGLFLLLYGSFRFAVEFVRVPDENRAYLLWDWVTMGQLLSAPMLVAGLLLLAMAYRRGTPSGNYTQ